MPDPKGPLADPPHLQRGRERRGLRCSRAGEAAVLGQVLIVDDDSPDGTGADRRSSGRAAGNVSVLRRPTQGGHRAGLHRGLPPGPRRGRRAHAGDGLRLLPRPAYLPRLLEAAQRADLALGSRYVPGGGVATGDRSGGRSAVAAAPTRGWCWGWSARPDRRLQVLPPRGAGGDRPRRDQARGYAFQVEMTYRAIQHGYRVVEVPIVFRERRRGSLQDGRAGSSPRRFGGSRCCASVGADLPPDAEGPAPCPQLKPSCRCEWRAPLGWSS